MKNKKFKLFASLTSLVMVVAVMAVGVWAATTASVGVTGTVKMTAGKQVVATVDVGTLSATNTAGDELTVTATTADPTAVEFKGGEDAAEDENKGTLAYGDITITGMQDFTSAVTITYTITITNGYAEGSNKSITYNVSLADNAADDLKINNATEAVTGSLADGADFVTVEVSLTFDPTIAQDYSLAVNVALS